MLQLVPQAVDQDAGPFTFPGARIIGVGDITQFIVKAAPTQTNNLVEVQANDGSQHVTITGLGETILDVTSIEALVVRKNADGGDVFTVDTTTPKVIIDANLEFTGAQSITTSASDLTLNPAGFVVVAKSLFLSALLDQAIDVDTTADYIGAKLWHTKTAGATDTADTFYGVYGLAHMNQSGGTISHLYGELLFSRITDGGVGDVSNARQLIGLVCSADLDGGKVWGNVFGLESIVDQEAGNEVTGDIRGLSIRVDADGTLGGNAIMLYLDERSNIDFGIYQNGTAINFLAGRTGVNVVAPLAMIHVDQSSSSGAIPVLTLDQADVSDGFINFIGSDRGVIGEGTSSAVSVRVELGGVVYRLALYADA